MKNDNAAQPHKADGKKEASAESTIFVKREYDESRRTENGAKRRTINLAALVLCGILIAVSGYAVVRFVPKSYEPSQIKGEVLSVTAISRPMDTVTEISVVGADKGFTVFSDKNKSEWQLAGIDSELTDSDSIAAFVSACTSLEARRRLENNGENFGMSSPYLKITVSYADSKMNYEITVGGQTADKSARYLSVTDNGGVFVVDSQAISELDKTEFDFAKTLISEKISDDNQSPEYFEGSTIKFFDTATVTDKKGALVFKFVRDAGSQKYKMTYPEQKTVSNDAVGEYLSLLTNNLYAAGVYSYSKNGYSARGFAQQYTVTVSAADGKHKNEYIVSKSHDGEYYAVVVDSRNPIFKVSTADSFLMLQKTAKDYQEPPV